MVEVEVGENDVAYIVRPKPKSLDLTKRRLFLSQPDIQHCPHRACNPRARPLMRPADVAQPVACVYQYQTVLVRFDQEAVADKLTDKPFASAIEQRSAKGAVGATIHVVNTHIGFRGCQGKAGTTDRAG